MKRKCLGSNKHNLVAHYTYFKWHDCCVCNQEFRREHGFTFMWHGVVQVYICGTCSGRSMDYTNQYIDYMYGRHSKN